MLAYLRTGKHLFIAQSSNSLPDKMINKSNTGRFAGQYDDGWMIRRYCFQKNHNILDINSLSYDSEAFFSCKDAPADDALRFSTVKTVLADMDTKCPFAFRLPLSDNFSAVWMQDLPGNICDVITG